MATALALVLGFAGVEVFAGLVSGSLALLADAASWLDGKHTVFGKVTSGQDVADKIAMVERDGRDVPLTPVTIDRVELA